MVMSMMFMNMAATKTTLTLILGLMRIKGMAGSWSAGLPSGRPADQGRKAGVIRGRHRAIRGHSSARASRRPRSSGRLPDDETEPDLAVGVVTVGVDHDHALPRAQLHLPLHHRNGQRRG